MTKYWKSLKIKDGKIISDYDTSEWTIGKWRSVPAPKKKCEGLNCCENIVDAMNYVEMEVLAEVKIKGKKIVGMDKITVEKMRIVRAWKWEKKDSVALSIYSAELCIGNFEKKYPEDDRPREAIGAAKAWLSNPCEETESAARSAADSARSAADSAWSAAESARSAWSAAESAWSAAESAWSAAESATWSAWSAAWSAWSAAWSAAESAAKENIHSWIVEHIPELEEIGGEP